jgi:hypothetical protein
MTFVGAAQPFGGGLLRLDAGILDHLAPFAELDLDEVGKLPRRA